MSNDQEKNEVAPPLCGGRYRLIEVLGTGGMAKVYKAFDRRLEVYRAIKVLSPTYAAHPEIRKRFLAEARTTARLAHPNIVMAHDIGADGDRLFIVMELVEGGSIWDRMRETGPLSPTKALEVMVALLPALAVAHEQGVIHRDIKPGNILVTKDGAFKLADFGIARVAETERNETRTGSLLGTPAYMAPEQWNGSKELDGRADLFAMAATLYSLVTLQTPQDLHIPEAQEEQLRALPEPLRQLITRAVRYRATDRYATANEMLDAVYATMRRISGVPAMEPGAGRAAGGGPRSKPGLGGRSSLQPEWDGARMGLGSVEASVSANDLLQRSRPPVEDPLRAPLSADTTGRRRLQGLAGEAVLVEVPELKPEPALAPPPLQPRPSPALQAPAAPTRPNPLVVRPSQPASAPAVSSSGPTRPLTNPTLASAQRPADGRARALKIGGVALFLALALGGGALWTIYGDSAPPEPVKQESAPKPAPPVVAKPAAPAAPAKLPALSPDTPQGTLSVECRPDCPILVDNLLVGTGRVEGAVKAGRHVVGVGPIGARVTKTISVPQGQTASFCWDTANRKSCAP